MSYDLIPSTATKKFIKKIKDKPLKDMFKAAFKDIQQNPFEVGEPKTGDLAGVYGFDFKYQGTTYEIAYSVDLDDDGNVILVILAGTREQFYTELKRYIKGR